MLVPTRVLGHGIVYDNISCLHFVVPSPPRGRRPNNRAHRVQGTTGPWLHLPLPACQASVLTELLQLLCVCWCVWLSSQSHLICHVQWFCSPMGNPKKPMGRQSSWETSGSWELGTWRFLGGNWEARVRVRVRESWEAKKMTKKTRGIEPCLAHESWSSLEESASPLQHSLKPACKILAI